MIKLAEKDKAKQQITSVYQEWYQDNPNQKHYFYSMYVTYDPDQQPNVVRACLSLKDSYSNPSPFMPRLKI